MGYLITQIWIYLLIAAAIGFVVTWRTAGAKLEQRELEDEQ